MANLEGIPALLYTVFWPLKMDGRLSETKDIEIKLLVFFHDYPPGALLSIKNGDFSIVPISEAVFEIKKEEVDVLITGYFQDTVNMIGGLLDALKVILKRRVKVKNRIKALKFLKILNVKHIEEQPLIENRKEVS